MRTLNMRSTIVRCQPLTQLLLGKFVSLNLEGHAGLVDVLEHEVVVLALVKAVQERRALGRASAAQKISKRREHGVLGVLGLGDCVDFFIPVDGESTGS